MDDVISLHQETNGDAAEVISEIENDDVIENKDENSAKKSWSLKLREPSKDSENPDEAETEVSIDDKEDKKSSLKIFVDKTEKDEANLPPNHRNPYRLTQKELDLSACHDIRMIIKTRTITLILKSVEGLRSEEVFSLIQQARSSKFYHSRKDDKETVVLDCLLTKSGDIEALCKSLLQNEFVESVTDYLIKKHNEYSKRSCPWDHKTSESSLKKLVYVRDVPADVDEESLVQVFPEAKCTWLPLDDKGKKRGYAYVEYNSIKEAQKAADKYKEIIYWPMMDHFNTILSKPQNKRFIHRPGMYDKKPASTSESRSSSYSSRSRNDRYRSRSRDRSPPRYKRHLSPERSYSSKRSYQSSGSYSSGANRFHDDFGEQRNSSGSNFSNPAPGNIPSNSINPEQAEKMIGLLVGLTENLRGQTNPNVNNTPNQNFLGNSNQQTPQGQSGWSSSTPNSSWNAGNPGNNQNWANNSNMSNSGSNYNSQDNWRSSGSRYSR